MEPYDLKAETIDTKIQADESSFDSITIARKQSRMLRDRLLIKSSPPLQLVQKYEIDPMSNVVYTAVYAAVVHCYIALYQTCKIKTSHFE